jgi:[protein-PII] uridylyltransferase
MIEVEESGPAARRVAAAVRLVGGDEAAAARIGDAPAGYVLAHDSSDIARHCSLFSPLPGPDHVRVVATPGRAAGEWHLDVGARDRPGLLAAFTGVLAGHGVDVVQAVLATWDDGAALEAFVVRSSAPPDVRTLQAAFEGSLGLPLWSAPVADASVAFDRDASPLYTACEVRAADRPGLLHAVAVALAEAGADVHAARVVTVGGVARDRFDLSDGAGAKLGPAQEDAVRAHIAAGVAARPARPARRRVWPAALRTRRSAGVARRF